MSRNGLSSPLFFYLPRYNLFITLHGPLFSGPFFVCRMGWLVRTWRGFLP
jgi:hypothetical protein